MAKRTNLVPGTELPSVLSFRRSIECGDATMSGAVAGGGSIPLDVYLHGQRPTKSFAASKADGDTQGAGANEASNLVYGERAKLPASAEALQVNLQLKVLKINSEPDACNDPAWFHSLSERLQDARSSPAFEHIARCYAYAIANGAWLWRNRDVADDLSITVKYGYSGGDPTTFVVADALDWPLRAVATASEKAEGKQAPYEQKANYPGFGEFSKAVEAALRGLSRPLRIAVEARIGMAPGQDTWPSQLYIPGGRKVGKVPVGRNLFRVGGAEDGPVGLTAEKITNALRTFDNSHAHDAFGDEIIPIEPNGGSLRFGLNLRNGQNKFYKLVPRWLSGEVLPIEEEAYMLSCFIRGGVFGAEREDEKPQKVAKGKKGAEVVEPVA